MVNCIDLSSLSLAEGTTEKLSKIWMPLDQYTKETVEGLQRGDHVVASGNAKIAYEKFEQGKEELMRDMYKRTFGNRYVLSNDGLHNTDCTRGCIQDLTVLVARN